MTTFPSNQNRDWTATQAAPRRTPSPDMPTMAAYFPPTAPRQAYGSAYGQPQLAWSAEQPEFNSAPEASPARQPWYARPRVLAFAGAGFVVAAAAGLFGAPHGSSSATPVNTSALSAPAPAPTPAPMPAVQPSAPSYRSMSHPAKSGGGYSARASRQAPPQTPPAPQGQPSGDQSGRSYQDNGSDPSQWNNADNYWWIHSGDHDGRWRGDHDSRWNFWNHDRDGDGSRSSNRHGDNSNSSNDQSTDSYSNGNGDSK